MAGLLYIFLIFVGVGSFIFWIQAVLIYSHPGIFMVAIISFLCVAVPVLLSLAVVRLCHFFGWVLGGYGVGYTAFQDESALTEYEDCPAGNEFDWVIPGTADYAAYHDISE